MIEAIEDFGLEKRHKSNTLFSRIGVVGCGSVGQNIANIASQHGIEVVFVEVSEEKITMAKEAIAKSLDRQVENWGLTTSEKKAILNRITGTTSYKDLSDCDFVIEAIRSESSDSKVRTDLRKTVFCEIEAAVSPSCIIASNSSTVAITELASELKHNDRCVNLHFFVQSHEARVCEVVRALYTSDEVYTKVESFVTMLKRDIIAVTESAGLVSVRLLCTLLNEACAILQEGVCSVGDIDKVMQTGHGMRFGTFELADLLGLDKLVRYMENLYDEFGNIKYKPSPVLLRLVRSKRFGIQSGEGFYKYDENGIIDRTNYLKL